MGHERQERLNFVGRTGNLFMPNESQPILTTLSTLASMGSKVGKCWSAAVSASICCWLMRTGFVSSTGFFGPGSAFGAAEAFLSAGGGRGLTVEVDDAAAAAAAAACAL